MKVHQIAPTAARSCGVGNFALALEACLRRHGCEVATATSLSDPGAADVVLIQYGERIYDDAELARYCSAAGVPVVVFAHFAEAGWLDGLVDGFMTLSPGLLSSDTVPVLPVPHPARVPERLEDRGALKREFGLPDTTVVASSGFLMFHREFPAVLERLLPVVEREGWFVDLVTSDWFRPSPGLAEQLDEIVARHAGCARYNRSFLPGATLNRRLQACDLLWCWTGTPSSPYGSGSVSDQYASGSRLYVAGKQQHEHVLGLPNVVRGPATLGPFLDGLVAELRRGVFGRHDPAPVSWDRVAPSIVGFLAGLVDGNGPKARATVRGRAGEPYGTGHGA